jgi:phosphoribosylanthranilate isomerase
MTKIKICGLTREDDAVEAARLGADFLGLIFVPASPRFVEPERAAVIAARVRDAGHGPKFVGVFHDASADYMREIASLVGLDLFQLHGSEHDDEIRDLNTPVIKTLRVGDILPDTHGTPSAAWLLFDTYDARRVGGTGRRFDWSLLAMYERNKPFFLSGGLNAENVVAGLTLVRPDAIDVSSGVESDEPGVKDHGKMKRLFDRVRRAEARPA